MDEMSENYDNKVEAAKVAIIKKGQTNNEIEKRGFEYAS
jgi:hypothetical protein